MWTSLEVWGKWSWKNFIHEASSPCHLNIVLFGLQGWVNDQRIASSPKRLLRMDSHWLSPKLFSGYGLQNVFIYRHHPLGQTGTNQLPFGLGPFGNMAAISSITQAAIVQASCLFVVYNLSPGISFTWFLFIFSFPLPPVPLHKHARTHAGTQFPFNWAVAIFLRRF